jgi:hypothetical protein
MQCTGLSSTVVRHNYRGRGFNVGQGGSMSVVGQLPIHDII